MSDAPYTMWNGREFLTELRLACQAGNGTRYLIGKGLQVKNNVLSVKYGKGLTVNDDSNELQVPISTGLNYGKNGIELKQATKTSLGGVVIGDGLNINNGVLSTELAALNTQVPLDLGEDTQTMVLLYDEDTLHVNYEDKLTVRGVSSEGIATKEEIEALF